MAQMVLIMGESGTGKSTSLRNCDPQTTAVVNPVGKPLPFKGRYEMLNSITESRKITKFMKEQAAAGKKLIVVDDFQYILSVPYMNRIKENGWDKWNDFGANYFEIIEVCKELPDDIVVAYMTHTETLENGVTTIKLIGKLLREKITIEGLFTIVLRTGVNEGKYYFYTQNSGKDTVKSPMGMFPSYAIDNDLNYVADKIRNFYEVGEYKTDAEINQADAAVATEIEKPDTNGRRGRGGRKSKTHDEVVAENQEKMDTYREQVGEAIDDVAGEREEIPFEEAAAAAADVEKPVLETPPRRTRKERQAVQTQISDGIDNTDSESITLVEDAYFYRPSDGNYLMKHKGDTVDIIVNGERILECITKEAFGEGVKNLSQQDSKTETADFNGAMNPPESGRRTRRTQLQPVPKSESESMEQESGLHTRRTRRTR